MAYSLYSFMGLASCLALVAVLSCPATCSNPYMRRRLIPCPLPICSWALLVAWLLFRCYRAQLHVQILQCGGGLFFGLVYLSMGLASCLASVAVLSRPATRSNSSIRQCLFLWPDILRGALRLRLWRLLCLVFYLSMCDGGLFFGFFVFVRGPC